jgi:ATP-dependent DNA helicase RecG
MHFQWIVSYPGPDRSIRIEDLNGERIVARRYRNRRVGEFLKELELTEGRCTGIPTMRAAMAQNGSSPPRFATDEDRTHFFVELLVHPEWLGVLDPHDEAHDDLNETKLSVLRFVADKPRSKPEIADHLGMSRKSGSLYRALNALRDGEYISFTLPEKPQSPNQQYRITRKGSRSLGGV